MVLLCIDESGNTQDVIALGLVSIPDKAIEPLCQLFTLRPTDPKEIQALYHRDPEAGKRKRGEPLKPRDEFKYSDFLHVENAANLPVYREFINDKFKAAARLQMQAYCSVFDKPGDNAARLQRLNIESQTLLHTWQQTHLQDALSKDLKIIVDQQVFPEEMLFQVYERRNKRHCEIFPTRIIGGKRHYGGRENQTIILARSSSNFKPLQFTDFVVGAIREAIITGREETLESMRPLIHNKDIRDTRGNYSIRRGVNVLGKKEV